MASKYGILKVLAENSRGYASDWYWVKGIELSATFQVISIGTGIASFEKLANKSYLLYGRCCKMAVFLDA